jgi:small subunit ribosomal protein S15Ae
MTRISVVADALKTMYNAEKRGKKQVLLRPSSKVLIKCLSLMMKHGYIGEFEFVDNHRSGKIVVELNGRLNKCGAISPRFDIAANHQPTKRRDDLSITWCPFSVRREQSQTCPSWNT